MKLRYIILLGLLSVSILASAQEPAGTWHHFINSTSPRDMIADGPYLWIATDGGLVKFNRDSGTFVIFTTDNSGLPDNALFRLMLDQQHSLWVSTQGGELARFQDESWTVFNNNNSPLPPPGNGNCIPACDSLGRIWVASLGLLEYINGKWTKYDTTNSPMCSSQLEAITADRKGNIWIGTQNKDTTKNLGYILKFDGDATWEIHNDTLDGVTINDTFYFELPPPGNDPWSLLVDDSDELWVGFSSLVERLVPGVGWNPYSVPSSGAFGNPIFSLVQNSGYIWGADINGAVQINDTFARYVDVEEKVYGSGFPFNGTSAIVSLDSELWFAGYGGGGIARYKDSSWTVYSNLSTTLLTSNQVGCMTVDTKDKVWFSAMRGGGHLSTFDGSTWQNFDTLMHGIDPFSLCADSSGNIWIGTNGSGLIKFDGAHAQQFNLNSLLNFSNVVASIAFDKKRGVLWIGTQEQGNGGLPSGLVKFDGTNWTTYTPQTSPLPYLEVTSLRVDTSGLLWIGTFGEGLATLDSNNNWTLITQSNSSLPSNNIIPNGITSAPNGDVWVLTDKSPAKWNGKSWTTYPEAPLTGVFSGCAIDTQGQVWFSSYGGGGACKFDGNTWTTYTPENSLIGSEWVQAVVADRRGNIWLGTDGEGVAEYVPSSPASVSPISTISSSIFAIYPNPTTAILHIESTSNDITITDLLGRTWLHSKDGTHALDVNGLPQGVYFISDGTSRAQFVKE
jgi:ligand-binding sensor domain-containing protein